MPRPSQRARSLKKRATKMPSGSGLTTHYERAKVKKSHCAKCGRVLPGATIRKLSELRRLSLTEKRPQRIFGGQLCHACVQEAMKQAARGAAS